MKPNRATLVAIIFLGFIQYFSQTVSSQTATPAKPTTEQEIADHRAKAQQYLMRKEPELAIPELQTLETLDPNDADVHGNLGVLFYFKNDCAHAVPELRQATDLHAGLWQQVVLLGFCEQRLGDVANAKKDLEAAFPHIEEEKLNRAAGEALIHLYSEGNDLPKAVGVIDALRTRNPTDVQLIYTAYQMYTDLASEAMITLSLVNPDSPEMHRLMAHESMRYGDRVTSINHLREVIKLDPKLPGIHLELADALNSPLEGGNKEEAEKEYKLALTENPNDEVAECRLGEIASGRGDVQESYAHYSHAIALQPTEPLANLGLAKALAAMKQPDKAAALLEGVIERDPTNEIAHFRLSSVYRQLGRQDDAKRELVEYQKYKEMKDKLRKVYQSLRLLKTLPEDSDADAQK